MLIMIFGLQQETAKASKLLVQVNKKKKWRVSKL